MVVDDFKEVLSRVKHVAEFDKIVSGTGQIIKLMQFLRCHFFINIHYFPHLKLEIALAILASNEWKMETTNSGVGLHVLIIQF